MVLMNPCGASPEAQIRAFEKEDEADAEVWIGSSSNYGGAVHSFTDQRPPNPGAMRVTNLE